MAAESPQTLLLLAVLGLSIFANPCEGQELRCQCIQTHSDFISPKFITNVQLIPEGAHCSRKEIIVTLKDGTLVCLDPEAEWVMIIIKKIINRQMIDYLCGNNGRRRDNEVSVMLEE